MMSHGLRLAALSAAMLMGAVSVADARSDADRPGFEALDSNGDGQLTKAEMDAHRAARFSRIDTDGDGLLSQAELEASGAERAERRARRIISHLDKDGDGKLSETEMRAGGRGDGRLFERADTNNDGTVSKAEFDAVSAKLAERRAKRAAD